MEKQHKRKAVCVLGGIDSLYYFVHCDSELYQTFYENINIDVNLFASDNFRFLKYTSKSDGVVGIKFEYSLDDVKIAGITFKNPEKQKNIHNVYVQLYAESIYSKGLKNSVDLVSELLFNLFGLQTFYDFMYPSRVDVNCFVGGFDFSQISKDCFGGYFYRTYQKENTHFITRASRVETLYLGSKKSSLCFKIYDKLKELHDKRSSLSSQIKLEFLRQNGFGVEYGVDELWNAEFTCKRQFLKESGILSLDALFGSFKMLYFNCFSGFDFYGFDARKIAKYRKNRNLNKLEVHKIWKLMQVNQLFNAPADDFAWGDRPVERVIERAKGQSEKWHREQILKLIQKCSSNGWDIKDIFRQAV